MKATILIGISGSGKSTAAKKIEGKHCSADNFFMNSAGEYKFDYRQLSEAHAWCMRTFINALSLGEDTVVDNTNTSVAEVSPYLAVAAAMYAEVDIVLIDCDPEVAFLRNVHGVSKSGILGQSQRLNEMLENWPSYWPKIGRIDQAA